MKPESLPWAWGGPAGSGRLRTTPADFQVEEILGFDPDGRGEHAWLWVRKTGANSEDVAHALARFAGVRRKDVGMSGMKDHRAETRQWFSVHLPGRVDPDWSAMDCAQWRIESTARHGRKLRTGTHRANRFRLRVRAVDADPDTVEARLACIRAHGFPNYFGPQRFGRGGENLRKARGLLAGERRAGRHLRGLYLSAARAWLFNRVLARRVEADTWCTPAPGDALMLDGTHSMFCCTGDEPDLEARIAAGDLHVTGPLWGAGPAVADARQLARERQWLADEPALVNGLEEAGIRASRRPLRALARDLEGSLEDGDLNLAFVLAAGVYATTLVRELLGDED